MDIFAICKYTIETRRRSSGKCQINVPAFFADYHRLLLRYLHCLHILQVSQMKVSMIPMPLLNLLSLIVLDASKIYDSLNDHNSQSTGIIDFMELCSSAMQIAEKIKLCDRSDRTSQIQILIDRSD